MISEMLKYAYFLIFDIVGCSVMLLTSPRIGTKKVPKTSMSSSPLNFYKAFRIHKLLVDSKFYCAISPLTEGGYIYKILLGPKATKIECITLLKAFSSNSSLKLITSTISS